MRYSISEDTLQGWDTPGAKPNRVYAVGEYSAKGSSDNKIFDCTSLFGSPNCAW